MGRMETITKQSPQGANNVCPAPPPLPGAATNFRQKRLFMMNNGSAITGNSCVSTATRDMWDSLFDGGYRADVTIKSNNGGIIYAHANVLGMASPVLRGMLIQAKGFGQKGSISIHGVPEDAVRVFIRFLYSSWNFKVVSATEGWKAMKKSHPALEKELVKSMIDEENMKKEKIKRSNERKIYLELCEAMEALVHICRDGCRTIGPRDKHFKEEQKPCNYRACKGLELLIRHFAGCKLRVPGGCIHCKRMWQLLELHSRLCADSSSCKVPLCRNFKEKIRKQSKKDEIKWKILVKKILRIKRIGGGAPFSVYLNSISSRQRKSRLLRS
ncbi:BTB/POZ and TAZ domain-containing protein 4-like isoform X2 [Durio zibethinus]|uniref:BTB/POZ and TAZ domain-containing protein 4-like isoform X2 n=1 Tax=Durio zibethinus TaxID=66656 RepID=A0A6P5YL41_DURZI|nr:BTB/POZ and TAZ domain-containing protein 4-like isoform X2 [Durio zibethinus]